jgi:ribosomal protein S18 acetylase RimI-like enzyme
MAMPLHYHGNAIIWKRPNMRTEFRKAAVPRELRSLVIFDHQAFREYPADWFDREMWLDCEAWWMLIDGKRAGCCAFQRHVDFREDIDRNRRNPRLHGSLYIVTTGIRPQLRASGFGRLLKCWQVSYALHHGFTRIVTNTRKSNHAMIQLNRSFGFKVLRTTPDYYDQPREATVVMELLLQDRNRAATGMKHFESTKARPE